MIADMASVSSAEDYRRFRKKKSQLGGMSGFEPLWMPDWLFDFQADPLVGWAIRRGRAAIMARPGMGKTPMQLVWAQNVLQHTNRPVLVIAPLAVSHQTEREADKFGIEAKRSQDGKHKGGIVITNYERLGNFDENDFGGLVCDENVFKAVGGATRKKVTRFMSKLKFRLFCSGSPAPNDYPEFGTESEALGELSYTDMLRMFFQQLDDKGQKREVRDQDHAEVLMQSDPNYFRKLAFRVAQNIGQWRLRHHAVIHFWRWIASWSRACRKPSDLGDFDDSPFSLPPLREHIHIIESKPSPGMLFAVPAVGMRDERQEGRRNLQERCECVAKLVDRPGSSVVWCHENPEADLLEKMIPGSAQIAGRTPEGRKLELYEAFASGQLKKLITKPKIASLGLNWQHCSHIVAFPSHSAEQYDQLICRCYRFGQKKPVDLDLVVTEGQLRVLGNLKRKMKRSEQMFENMIREMNHATRIETRDIYTKEMELPSWLFASSR